VPVVTAFSMVHLVNLQFVAIPVQLRVTTTTFSSPGRSGPELEIEMNASYSIRFAAIAVAVAMTAIVQGTMLAGFDNVAQQASARQCVSSDAVALQKVIVTAHKS